MYCDDDNVPNMVRRVDRDEAVISALEECVPQFCVELDLMEADIRSRYNMGPRKSISLDCLSGDWCPFGGEEVDVSEGEMEASEL